MFSKVILVTGANRGIGYSIIQKLCQSAPSNTYVLAVRSVEAGEEAVRQLRELGSGSKFEVAKLDVTNDSQIESAMREISEKFGKVDVLINNAAYAVSPAPDNSDFRSVYNKVVEVNMTSVALLTFQLLPLLKRSPDPRVINVSSVRGSFAMQALNMVTVEMAKVERDVLFQLACPGHCKTGFNGYTGFENPLDGARVVEELVLSERWRYESGFWHFDDGEMSQWPW